MPRKTKRVVPAVTGEAKVGSRSRSGDSGRPPVPPLNTGQNKARPDEHLLQQYHHLVDKRLNGTLSKPDEQELDRIKEALEWFEDAETAEMERNIERRHRMIMKQLKDLTAELREFSRNGSPRAGIQ